MRFFYGVIASVLIKKPNNVQVSEILFLISESQTEWQPQKSSLSHITATITVPPYRKFRKLIFVIFRQNLARTVIFSRKIKRSNDEGKFPEIKECITILLITGWCILF
jgi:hypothetical protein